MNFKADRLLQLNFNYMSHHLPENTYHELVLIAYAKHNQQFARLKT